MTSKNTVCLWFDGTALDAAEFYARTFPNSEVKAVHRRRSTLLRSKRPGAADTADVVRARVASHRAGYLRVASRAGWDSLPYWPAMPRFLA